MDKVIQLTHTVGKRYVEKGPDYLQSIDSCPYFTELRQAFNNITIDDLKLSRDKAFFFNKDELFTTMDLVNEEQYRLFIFFMSAGKVFPLHDHPNRVIISNVLQGKSVERSFEIKDQSKQACFQRMYAEGQGLEPESAKELQEGLEVEDKGASDLSQGGGYLITTQDGKFVHGVENTEDFIFFHMWLNSRGPLYMYSKLQEAGGKVSKLKMDGLLPPIPAGKFRYEDYRMK